MHMAKVWAWKVLWVLSALSFILAWVSVIRQAPIGQFDPLFLLWNALILGILASSAKHEPNCGTCEVKPHHSA
jgi:hypothetical protein